MLCVVAAIHHHAAFGGEDGLQEAVLVNETAAVVVPMSDGKVRL
jgi:hypothetical protein